VRLLRLKFRIKNQPLRAVRQRGGFSFSAAQESEMNLTGYIGKKTCDRSVITTPVVPVIVSAAAIIAVIAIIIVIVIVPPPGAA
jgi:hypothetical protein